jgi:hypothetical protein
VQEYPEEAAALRARAAQVRKHMRDKSLRRLLMAKSLHIPSLLDTAHDDDVVGVQDQRVDDSLVGGHRKVTQEQHTSGRVKQKRMRSCILGSQGNNQLDYPDRRS